MNSENVVKFAHKYAHKETAMKDLSLLLFVLITQAFAFDASLCAATDTISAGEIKSGSIAAPGQTNYYNFTGASNEVITVALLRTNGTGSAYLYLYDPMGNKVFEGR